MSPKKACRARALCPEIGRACRSDVAPSLPRRSPRWLATTGLWLQTCGFHPGVVKTRRPRISDDATGRLPGKRKGGALRRRPSISSLADRAVQCAVRPEPSSSTAGSAATAVAATLAFSSSHSIGSGLRTSARGQNLVHAGHRNDLQPLLDVVADLGEVLGVLLRDQHRLDAAARGRQQLLLQAADRQDAAAQRDLAGHRDVAANRNAGHHRDDRRHHGDAGRRAVLRGRPLRHVDVDVLLIEGRRLDAEGDRPHADVGRRRGDRFLHHVAQVARDRHLALAGHHGGFDGEQLAADVGPGQAGDDADLILVLEFAVAELRHAEEVGDPLVPEGGQALGAGVRDDVLLIFATNGLWELSGLHFNIVDPNGNQQHRLRRVSEDLILVNNEGIATWLGRLVTPCADGIWLVDGVSEPVRVSDSISALWRAYVQLGYRAGQATVFRSHYLLPVLDGGGTPVDMLVCRLDRQVPTRLGQVRPWTRMSGFGGSSAAMAVRPGGASGSRQPRLLAGSEDGRVADSTAFFEPSGASALDADDSEVMGEIQTRDYPVKDGLGFGTVRKIRARYELYSTEEAGLELAYATGLEEGTEGIWDVSLWDEATWAGGLTDDPVVWSIIAGLAPEDNGEHAYTWRLVKKARFIRFRLRLSGPASKLVLRTLELFARHSGKA